MLSTWLKRFAIATVFLTRLPVPTLKTLSAEDNRQATLLFPAVGLLIGVLLLITASLSLAFLPANVAAAIVLIVWVFVTGGLHIDGLADSADAWLGGLGNTERSLSIMKDPRCGSGALAAVGCLLIGKYACLQYLLEQDNYQALLVIPMLGRMASLLIFRTTAYVRSNGLANDFLQGLDKTSIDKALVVYLLLIILLTSFQATLLIISLSAIAWFLLRRLMLKRLGGCTGDTAGATVELIELCALVMLCSY